MRCTNIRCPMQYPYDVYSCNLNNSCNCFTPVLTNGDLLSVQNDDIKALTLCNLFESLRDCKGRTDYRALIYEWFTKPVEE